MSGLLALLDDVAAIAKLAATSVDDIAAAEAKSGAKAAGTAIDDAAVAPRFTAGLPAERELSIVGQIALGSIRNKLVVLLPAALILEAFLPRAIEPLLMLGGFYLSYEGAEKVFHMAMPHADRRIAADLAVTEPGHLEARKVAGAIKTDFVLSAEIMTIALAALPEDSLWIQGATLAVVAVAITALVYGSVALIVRADDLGVVLASRSRFGPVRVFGRGLVQVMPRFLAVLAQVGTWAMLWVGGSILLHGAAILGWAGPAHLVEGLAHAASAWTPAGQGAVAWLVEALAGIVVGLALGSALVPVASRVILPLWARITGKKRAAH